MTYKYLQMHSKPNAKHNFHIWKLIDMLASLNAISKDSWCEHAAEMNRLKLTSHSMDLSTYRISFFDTIVQF